MSLLRRFERMAAQRQPSSCEPEPSMGEAGASPRISGSFRMVSGRRGTPDMPDMPDLRAALLAVGGELWGEALASGQVTRLLCIDAETTGIAASSHPFVTGVAQVAVSGGAIQVEQLCIDGPAGELAAMRALIELVEAPGGALVSFNGASFDLPLLRRRALRLGLSLPACMQPGALHLDLLHPARRLWQGDYENCRLVTLEAKRFGRVRVGDIPSHLIPFVYEELARDPTCPRARADYERVVEHNRLDIVSLPELLLDMSTCLANPRGPSQALRVATHHVRVGAAARARACLHAQLWPGLSSQTRAGTAPLSLDAELAFKGGALLAAQLARRAGAYEAQGQWLAAAHALLPDDDACCEAYAIYLEHRRRQPAQALRVASAAREPCEKRISRLTRKLCSGDLSDSSCAQNPAPERKGSRGGTFACGHAPSGHATPNASLPRAPGGVGTTRASASPAARRGVG